MIEPFNRVRSGSVSFQNPFADTRIPGCKKLKMNKISWRCGLRRSRANSDPGSAATAPLVHSAEDHEILAACPSLLRRGSSAITAVPINQPEIPSSARVASFNFETDFHDGSPKMWKESQKFFCDDTVYHSPRNPPPNESVNQFREDTKIWLEGLASRSKSIRDQPKTKIIDDKKNVSNATSGGGLSVAPPRLTPRVKNSSWKVKPDARSDYGGHPDRLEFSSGLGAGHPERQLHLNVPYLESLKRSESPSLYRAPFENGDVSSLKHSSRLVSTWSSDTLSLFAAESQESESSFSNSPQTEEGEEGLSGPGTPASGLGDSQ
ncbi:hypothetical protein MJO28_005938 [Puccinia striiformis f. sp. tritici]|uniref:Uncharacterized protein n=1 Tax=Puccinia striiformis f. sp. tritici TaxID=168172 RepID=A0ACC0EHK0_9BASI|nr:hypothetical protein Pst134EB_012152 [Puccinia striiformis f. sp. tritici]KAI7953391.1 hypothetical protein MJO28_005938 [Puccinia striiformis f. sp. tritici]